MPDPANRDERAWHRIDLPAYEQRVEIFKFTGGSAGEWQPAKWNQQLGAFITNHESRNVKYPHEVSAWREIQEQPVTGNDKPAWRTDRLPTEEEGKAGIEIRSDRGHAFMRNATMPVISDDVIRPWRPIVPAEPKPDFPEFVQKIINGRDPRLDPPTIGWLEAKHLLALFDPSLPLHLSVQSRRQKEAMERLIAAGQDCVECNRRPGWNLRAMNFDRALAELRASQEETAK